MSQIHSLATRIPLASFAVTLIICLAVYFIGAWQSDNQALEESDRLGNALAKQLADQARQPLLHDDLVSLQVIVSYLVDTTGIAEASVFDPASRALATSTKSKKSDSLKRYQTPILLEGKLVATSQISIDYEAMRSEFRQPLYTSLLIVSIALLACTALAIYFARQLTSRLTSLSKQIPVNIDNNTNLSELAILERQLEPLLTANHSQQQEPGQVRQIVTMGLQCRNLEQLEKQLSKDNFNRVLQQLETYLDKTIDLFEGKRFAGRDQTLFVEFEAEANGDQPLRAIFCAQLLLQLAELQQQRAGVGLQLSSAIRLSECNDSASLLKDFEREKRHTEIVVMASQTASGVIHTDSEIAIHDSVKSAAQFEQVPEVPGHYRVTEYSQVHQSLLKKQLSYIQNQ